MIASIVDAAFGSVFDEVFEEGEAFEDYTPSGGAGSFDGFPHEFGDDEDWMGLEMDEG